MNHNFDNIRPYTDEETSQALKRMAAAPELSAISTFLNGPGQDKEDALRALLRGLRTIDEFQARVMAGVIRSILHRTSTSLDVKGLDNVMDGRKHVLMSNHRDIILDPAIMQLILFDSGAPTTEIAVGDNLIANSLIEDIFRSNRMIKVVRGGTPREKYMASSMLSSYMRSNIASGRCSVWIAQRSGRSKDGCDATSQGVLKMLDMSGAGDFIKDFRHILSAGALRFSQGQGAVYHPPRTVRQEAWGRHSQHPYRCDSGQGRHSLPFLSRSDGGGYNRLCGSGQE